MYHQAALFIIGVSKGFTDMKYRYWFLGTILFYPLLSPADVETIRVPVIDGNNNLERIAADLHRLEKYVYRTVGADHLNKPAHEKAAASVPADQSQVDVFQSKFETLSQEIPALVGRIEELEHKNQKLLDNNKTFVDYLTRFKEEMAALTKKNQELEEKIAHLSTQPKESAPVKEEIPSLPPLTTQSEPAVEPIPSLAEPVVVSTDALEKKAKAALVAARYDDARELFEELLKRDLSIEQEVTTRFYLGEIWLLKKQHGKASEQYLKAYQKDPKGSKAPKNLLKLATSLYALGKKKEACVSLQKLLKDHPKAEGTILSMASEKRVEYCGA